MFERQELNYIHSRSPTLPVLPTLPNPVYESHIPWKPRVRITHTIETQGMNHIKSRNPGYESHTSWVRITYTLETLGTNNIHLRNPA